MAIEKDPSIVEKILRKADWSGFERLESTRDTNFWLYSISAVSGPRVFFNISRPMLDDMLSGRGKIAEIGKAMTPMQALTAGVAAFDDEKSPREKGQHAEPLALGMGAYAVAQRSWRQISGDSSDGDKHILILDWKTSAGFRCIQTGFTTPRGELPNKEAIINVCMLAYMKSFGEAPRSVLDA